MEKMTRIEQMIDSSPSLSLSISQCSQALLVPEWAFGPGAAWMGGGAISRADLSPE